MTIRKPSPIGLSLLAALSALVLGGPLARGRHRSRLVTGASLIPFAVVQIRDF